MKPTNEYKATAKWMSVGHVILTITITAALSIAFEATVEYAGMDSLTTARLMFPVFALSVGMLMYNVLSPQKARPRRMTSDPREHDRMAIKYACKSLFLYVIIAVATTSFQLGLSKSVSAFDSNQGLLAVFSYGLAILASLFFLGLVLAFTRTTLSSMAPHTPWIVMYFISVGTYEDID